MTSTPTSPPPPVQTYLVAGNITGLTTGGTPITLVNNGKDALTVNANGGFQFPTALASGAAYSITVATQPAGETCTVNNGSGTVNAANVTSISVSCSSVPAKTYTVGGNVAGLNAGASVTLKNNGSDTVSVSANGSFVFPVSLVDAAAYNVTVGTQPAGETCTASNAIGTVNGANVGNVSIVCIANAPKTYTVGGTVSGLSTGASVTLRDNGADATTVSSNGTFTFPTALQGGASWTVTVGTQPTGETCSVSNANGTKISANVTAVTVACTPNPTYSIGGSVSGLPTGSSVTLENNGSDLLTVPTNGTFVFSTQLASGATYNVTIATQPAGGNCTVTNGIGVVAAAGVTSVSVSCLSPPFLYVADVSNKGVDAYAFNAATGALTLLPGSPTTAGGYPSAIALNPGRTVAYVTLSDQATVVAYSIDGVTGALTRVGTQTGTGDNPLAVTVTPSGKFAYVANSGSNSVSGYTVNAATGALTPMPGGAFAAGIEPQSIAIDPTSRFAYVANSNYSNIAAGTISAYTIDAGTGALTAMSGSPFASAGRPQAITVNPAGTVAYTANYTVTAGVGGGISAWSIDPSTGALTLIGTFGGAGLSLTSIELNAAGTFAYAADVSSGFDVYAVNSSSGALTPITGSPFQLGFVQYGSSLALSTSGTLVYVTTNSGLLGYTVNASTGAPTAIPGGGVGIGDLTGVVMAP
ncbi:beta-propeller fold lactonase family protein [Paraburkholderia megapolitana]|uniref:beta-propeller fold lactonase family protein n=1 Tax=Paraburkholderia megapolitana TaxID=420953 RepID=UPI0038BD2EAD